MSVKTYTYCGPESLHSLIGQVMASLGYVGGRESRDVGAAITFRDDGSHLYVGCTFTEEGRSWSSEIGLLSKDDPRKIVKDCLIHWHQRFTGHGPGPWGTLIGVRPTKLVHHLFDQGLDEKGAEKILTDDYDVADKTAKDLVAMASLQRPYVTGRGRKIALYVGGGTPTCLPTRVLQPLMERLARNFPSVREWTVEAGRPDTAEEGVLTMLKNCGVNRISVNPQTMQQHLLDALGRRHSVDDIYTMYETCRKVGFSVINMDFIAGLPGQTVGDMQENMEIVCKLHPENVTIHTLALKKRAPLFHHDLREKIPPADVTGRMVSLCQSVLAGGGYVPYYMYRQKYMAASFANVGYALPGTVSAYNIEMMEERQSVLAAGPGGATKFLGRDGHTLEKVYMPKDVNTYIQALDDKMARRRRLCAIVYGGEDI